MIDFDNLLTSSTRGRGRIAPVEPACDSGFINTGVVMNLRASFPRFVFVLLVAITALSSLCAAQTYTVTDLGTLSGDDYSVARSINATGQVAGAVGSDKNNTSDVFLYSAGVMSSLGTLGGTSGIGNAINSSGQIAGYSTNASETYRAFLSISGKLTDIGDLGGGSAVAYGLNDAGEVVGSAVTADGSNHPFLYSNGVMTDLGTLGSPNGNAWWNSAYGVNKFGEAVGTSYDAAGNFLGFTWKNGTMTAQGTLGGQWSETFGINSKGQTTGIAYTKNNLTAHAYLCSAGKMTDLGTLAGALVASWGLSINDSGVVVGYSDYQSTYHAFVYSGGKMKDLNKLISPGSGWVLEQAYGVNNSGKIVGTGTLNGAEHGFLLTPK
jgi:probable HAF family extracellular repeat protein